MLHHDGGVDGSGYSLTFTSGNAFIGGLSRVMLNGLGAGISKGVDVPFTMAAGTDAATTMTIPESVWMTFQMTFAIITPALITGAFAERMKFSAMCVFTILWGLLVYVPVATGSGGRMVGLPARLARSTSPVAPSCISMLVLQDWLRPWYWGGARDMGKKTSLPIT